MRRSLLAPHEHTTLYTSKLTSSHGMLAAPPQGLRLTTYAKAKLLLVPRQSRGFTYSKLKFLHKPISSSNAALYLLGWMLK